MTPSNAELEKLKEEYWDSPNPETWAEKKKDLSDFFDRAFSLGSREKLAALLDAKDAQHARDIAGDWEAEFDKRFGTRWINAAHGPEEIKSFISQLLIKKEREGRVDQHRKDVEAVDKSFNQAEQLEKYFSSGGPYLKKDEWTFEAAYEHGHEDACSALSKSRPSTKEE